MIDLVLVVGWLACGVGGYVLVRSNRRRDSYWMVNERNGALACALLLAPIMLFAGLVGYGQDQEARW